MFIKSKKLIKIIKKKFKQSKNLFDPQRNQIIRTPTIINKIALNPLFI